MLPDRSLLIAKKLVENVRIEKFKCDISDDFELILSSFFLEKFIFKKKSILIVRKHLMNLKFSNG